jgi:hypothetical protein
LRKCSRVFSNSAKDDRHGFSAMMSSSVDEPTRNGGDAARLMCI